MNYSEKYLKYKTKYNNLKEQNGNQRGGGYFYEKNKLSSTTPKYSFKSCVIKVNLNEYSPLFLYMDLNSNSITQNRGTNLDHPFHISLLQFDINIGNELNLNNNFHDIRNHFAYRDNSNNENIKFLSKSFIRFIESINLKNKFLELFSNIDIETSRYDFLGEQLISDKKYKSYIVQSLIISSTQNKITEFRIYFYQQILQYIQRINPDINKYIAVPEEINGKKYFKLHYHKTGEDPLQKEPLFVIPEYYYGVGVWTPHISLAKIENNNNPIFRQILTANNEGDFDNVRNSIKSIATYNKLIFKFNRTNITEVSVN